MLREIRDHQRRAATLMAIAGLFALLATLGLLAGVAIGNTFGPNNPESYAGSPELALDQLHFDQVALRLSVYWASGMQFLVVASMWFLGWSIIESRRADRRLRGLKAGVGADTHVSLAAVDDLLETAKAQAATQQLELEQLESRIAAAEQMKGQADEELRRISEVLGLADLVGETKRWGQAQVALAIVGIALAIVLFVMAA